MRLDQAFQFADHIQRLLALEAEVDNSQCQQDKRPVKLWDEKSHPPLLRRAWPGAQPRHEVCRRASVRQRRADRACPEIPDASAERVMLSLLPHDSTGEK